MLEMVEKKNLFKQRGRGVTQRNLTEENLCGSSSVKLSALCGKDFAFRIAQPQMQKASLQSPNPQTVKSQPAHRHLG